MAREIEVHVEVGTEVAFYGKFDKTPSKKKIVKVHKNGRFLVEGYDEQFTPRRTWSGHSKWHADKREGESRYSIRVYPWSQHFDDTIASEKNRVVRQRQVYAIQEKIKSLHVTEGAKIDRLLAALGMTYENF